MTARYTASEKRRRAVLILRGSRQAIAGADTGRYDRRIDRIDAAAADRYQRETAAAQRLVDRAKDDVAAARAAERAADRKDRTKAKETRRKAEAALKRAEQAARKHR